MNNRTKNIIFLLLILSFLALLVFLLIKFVILKNQEKWNLCKPGERTPNNQQNPDEIADSVPELIVDNPPENQIQINQTPADKLNTPENDQANTARYNGRKPDGSKPINSMNIVCKQFCYNQLLVSQCVDGSVSSHVNKNICCSSNCSGNDYVLNCGVDNPTSRSFGNQPTTQEIQNDVVPNPCVPNEAVPRDNSVSYCESMFPNGCQINCPQGQRAVCSNGELRPPGCYCVNN